MMLSAETVIPIPKYFNSICRTCRKITSDMRQIFNSEINSIPISQMLSFATPISIRPDDKLPKLLCSFCLKKLIDAYQFQQMCIDSDSEMRNLLKNQIPLHTITIRNHNNNNKTLTNIQQQSSLAAATPSINNASSTLATVATSESDADASPKTTTTTPFINKIYQHTQIMKTPIQIIKNIEIKSKENLDNSITITNDEMLPQNDPSTHIDVIEYDGTVIKFENHNYDDLDYIEYDQSKLINNHRSRNGNNNQSTNIITASNHNKSGNNNNNSTTTTNQDTTSQINNKKIRSENGIIVPTIITPNVKCNSCSKEFLCQDDLEKHQTLVHAETPEIINLDYLEPDMDISITEDLHETSILKEILISAQESQVQNNLGKFSCTFCKNTFHSWENLGKHISEHKIHNTFRPIIDSIRNIEPQNNTTLYHQCKICQQQFEDMKNLDFHMTEQHNLNKNKNSVDDISTILSEPEILLDKIREVPVNNLDDFKRPSSSSESCSDDYDGNDDPNFKYRCQFCSNHYKNLKSLRAHVSSKHKKNISSLEKYQCTYCTKLFVRYLDMIRHRKSHKHNIKQRRIEKTSDHYKNNAATTLQSNQILKATYNDNDKNMKNIENNKTCSTNCTHCGKVFDNYMEMMIHLKTKHKTKNKSSKTSTKKLTSFQCPYCPSLIKYRHNLTRHLTNLHKHIKASTIQAFVKNAKRIGESSDTENVPNNNCAFKSCQYCKLKFTTNRDLKRHINKKHKTILGLAANKRYECRYCNKLYKNHIDLCAHQKLHKKRNESNLHKKQYKNDGFSCLINTEFIKVTPDTTSIVESLEDPLDIRKGNQRSGGVECSICYVILSSVYAYEGHMKRIHHNDSQTNKLKIKPSTSKSSNQVQITPVKNNSTSLAKAEIDFEIPKNGVDSWDCSECLHRYSTSFALRKHNITKHFNVNNMNSYGLYECKICHKKFIKKHSHSCHLRVHKTSTASSALGLSKRPILDKSSISHNNNENHKITLAPHALCPIDIDEKLRCIICKRIFSRIKSFRVHFKTNHSDKIYSENDGEYKCRLCHKRFKANASLQNHFMRHRVLNDEEPNTHKKSKIKNSTKTTNTKEEMNEFTCNYCDNIFHTNDEYEKHLSKHKLKNQIFECKICSKRIVQLSNLRSHMEAHKRRSEKEQSKTPKSSISKTITPDVVKNVENFIELPCFNQDEIDHNMLVNDIEM